MSATKVFLSGQSNANGQRTGGPAFSTLSPDVTAWNNENPLGSHGDAFIDPVEGAAPFHPAGNNNLGVWFCQHLVERFKKAVELTLVGKGSSSITLWEPYVGEMWDEIVAVWNAQGPRYSFEVFLWMQGENDNAMSKAEYKTRLGNLVAALRTERIITETAPIIVGGLASSSDADIDDALSDFAAENELAYYASGVGIPTADGDVHYSGQGLADFGYHRFFGEYMAHLNK